jgi:predicted DNA-binding ribbon-helix-helix protein
MRLEPEMWDALFEICRREGLSPHDICTTVEARRRASSLTAALRVFVMDYFRTASTEDGHNQAGHGVGLLHPPAETANVVQLEHEGQCATACEDTQLRPAT